MEGEREKRERVREMETESERVSERACACVSHTERYTGKRVHC